jgi:hypothetical protein
MVLSLPPSMDALECMVEEAARLQSAAAIPSMDADKLRTVMIEVAENLITTGAYAMGPWRTMKLAIEELERPRRPNQ